jgi:histidinol-phosphatase
LEADLRFAHELADAEDAIRALVAERRRGESVLGEEGGGSNAGGGSGAGGGGGGRWIVDPIDGTRYFIRGAPLWATLLALERDGIVDVAVVSAPALGRRWWAFRGGGAWADGNRCRVSAVARIEDAVVCTTSARDMPASWHALAKRAWVDGGFGDFWQYCLLAEGAVDVATDEVLDLWDYAAVRLIVEEAGGRCSTFTGSDPAPGSSFISSNGHLHDQALALLRGDARDHRVQTP